MSQRQMGKSTRQSDFSYGELKVPIEGPRVTYDKIDPAELEYPKGWKWDAKKRLVINKSIKNHFVIATNGIELIHLRTSCVELFLAHKPCPTLVAHMATDTYMYVHPTENRTITPQEAARIQSLIRYDSFDFGVVSFTSQYRQIGNAVPPFMAKAMMIRRNHQSLFK